MVDHALIALSPQVEGSTSHFQHEKDKAILLCQYLKALGYNVRFLVPEGMSVPFANGTCNKTGLLNAIYDIEKYADGDSNVIYYFSGAPREVLRIPVFLRDFYSVLNGWVLNPTLEYRMVRTFVQRISSPHGVRIETNMLKNALKEVISTGKSVFIDIKKAMGVLGSVYQSEIKEISDVGYLVQKYNEKNIAQKVNIQLPKDKIVKLLDIKDPGQLGLRIGPDHLAMVCKALLEMGGTYRLDVTFLVRLLRRLYNYILLQYRTAYLPLSENLSLDGLVYMKEIDEMLKNTTNCSMMVLGSGCRSGLFAEYLSGNDRLAISSMGPDQSPSMDNFNFGNGLVRARYTNLRKYTKGKNIDPLKAVSMEMIRMSMKGAARHQHPIAFFNHDYLKDRDLLPYLPPKIPGKTRLRTYDPHIGAFLFRYIPAPLPVDGSIPLEGPGSSVVSSEVSLPPLGPESIVSSGLEETNNT
ncbi:MAG: hypothetical protein JW939_04340 [Candidatus Thermoplasmatota archaeon]|nr:hypothetical protein [Candidatus Thermoplasmatota archaeon]